MAFAGESRTSQTQATAGVEVNILYLYTGTNYKFYMESIPTHLIQMECSDMLVQENNLSNVPKNAPTCSVSFVI